MRNASLILISGILCCLSKGKIIKILRLIIDLHITDYRIALKRS